MDERINVTGPAFIQQRTQLLYSNMLTFFRWLPDLQLYANGNDRSPRLLSADMRQWAADRNGGVLVFYFSVYSRPKHFTSYQRIHGF